MSKTKVYSYAKCSTCRKALSFLSAKGLKPEVIDITETPPSKKELKTMLKSYDGDLKRLFNTSGVAYRELKMKDRMATLTVSDAIDLLSANGRLVKRPFLLEGDRGLVGFKENEWQDLY